MSRKPLTKTRQPQRKRPVEPSESLTVTPKKTSRSIPARPKRWPWLIVIGIVLLLLIGLALRSLLFDTSPSSSSPSPNGQTAVSTSQVAWKTVQTFTGNATNNAEQKTKTFQVSGKWRMVWNCTGTSRTDDWLYVSIYNSNGSLYNAGAQATCVADKQIVGNAEESPGGTFYLSVNASVDWTVTVQVPQ